MPSQKPWPSPASTRRWKISAKTLFGEIARSADETWNRVYAGKTEVTHKALSPLRTLQQKLSGLTFINPHVSPVVDIIQMAFSRIPKKGNIVGADLVMLRDWFVCSVILMRLLPMPSGLSKAMDPPACSMR